MATYHHKQEVSLLSSLGGINWPSILGVLLALVCVGAFIWLRPNNQPVSGQSALPIASPSPTPSEVEPTEVELQETPVFPVAVTVTASPIAPPLTPTPLVVQRTNDSVPTEVIMSTPIATFTPRPSPTNTPLVPTNTPFVPTNTPFVPTNTPFVPTNTPVVPTFTPFVPTNTPFVPTNTPFVPTNTPVPVKNVRINLLSPFQYEVITANEIQFRVQAYDIETSDRLLFQASIDQQRWLDEPNLYWNNEGSGIYSTNINFQPGGFGFGRTYFWRVQVLAADSTILATSSIGQFRWEDPYSSNNDSGSSGGSSSGP